MIYWKEEQIWIYAWVHAFPSKSILGTLLDCHPVDRKGRHDLKCRKSVGRQAELNSIIKRELISADVPAVLEQVGLSREDDKKEMQRPLWGRSNHVIKWRKFFIYYEDENCLQFWQFCTNKMKLYNQRNIKV